MSLTLLSPLASLRVVLERVRPARSNVVVRALSRFAAQDWMVATYLMILTLAVLFGSGPRRATAVSMMLVDSAIFWACMVLARSDVLTTAWSGRLRFVGDLLYRVALIGGVIATFLQMLTDQLAIETNRFD